jgi:hypothetical protein
MGSVGQIFSIRPSAHDIIRTVVGYRSCLGDDATLAGCYARVLTKRSKEYAEAGSKVVRSLY